jgi:hypothetical protein
MLGSGGKENEILLQTPDTLVSQLEELRNVLMDPSKTGYERSSNHDFVCQYKNPDYYLCRCFASLFPYGRGCPSDKLSSGITMAKYVKHMLCMGGGPNARRFQQSSKFIFTLYTMEMKRKIGGVAYIAQRKNLDGSEVEKEEPPNISDINQLLSYLGGPINQGVVSGDNESTTQQPISTESTDANYNEREMQKLINRLIPYSKSLQGTAPHIAYERAKLMAMIPSPIISKLGLWRLFFTVAPADLFENRFYEVVQSPITDNTPASWQERVNKVTTDIHNNNKPQQTRIYL